MAISGTVNVVCHGTIAFVVDPKDGSIEVLIPEVRAGWAHKYVAGTWTGDRLTPIEAGVDYRLANVTSGDGKQRFDDTVNVCEVGPVAPRDPKKLRRFRLPPPKQIFSANYIPIDPLKKTFVHSNDPRAKRLKKKLATLSVLSYDCDDLSAVVLETRAGHKFPWLPQIVSDGIPAVNLHIFAEPHTFLPLEKKGPPPGDELPFNALLDETGMDPALKMLWPVGFGGFFSDIYIDPGDAIPGLPESEKLALCNHVQMVTSGLLHNHVHPFDCAPAVVQSGQYPYAETHATKRFAIRQDSKPQPKVLQEPRVVVIYWGAESVNRKVDKTVRKLLGLDFIKGALAEYGVKPPRLLAPIANPAGDKKTMKDDERVPTTPEKSAIARGLNDLILAHKVPDPRERRDLLYLIVAAPKATSGVTEVRGGHNYFYLEVPGAKLGDARVPVRYAWALQNKVEGIRLNALEYLTWTLSHELLEACTDPEPPSGVVFEGAEICDVASGLHSKVGGIEVTGYFSNEKGVYEPQPKYTRTVVVRSVRKRAGPGRTRLGQRSAPHK